jgi:hypothetical protein
MSRARNVSKVAACDDRKEESDSLVDPGVRGLEVSDYEME